MPVESKRGLLVSRTWVQAVVIVFLFGFLILGLLAWQTYTGEPPIPARTVDSAGNLLFTRDDILAGQGVFLRKVISGYYRYHAVPGNLHQLGIFRHRLGRLWLRVVGQRSQRGRMLRERWNRILIRWLPLPLVLHPHPRERFDARYPRWKPHA